MNAGRRLNLATRPVKAFKSSVKFSCFIRNNRFLIISIINIYIIKVAQFLNLQDRPKASREPLRGKILKLVVIFIVLLTIITPNRDQLHILSNLRYCEHPIFSLYFSCERLPFGNL